ncbi:unnamed protein product [Moneuplotes crassus]|uniref:Uncharacterized protein n=1 Tax=Euplotes crassus TaxID=5936 RepID=A0AAD1XGU3_EUPCR|nr:unnamed protein product [Moneuplotes crassus]
MSFEVGPKSIIRPRSKEREKFILFKNDKIESMEIRNIPNFNFSSQEHPSDTFQDSARYYSFKGNKINFGSRHSKNRSITLQNTSDAINQMEPTPLRRSRIAAIIDLNLTTERGRHQRELRLENKSKIHKALTKSVIRSKTRNELNLKAMEKDKGDKTQAIGLCNTSLDEEPSGNVTHRKRNAVLRGSITRRINNFSGLSMVPHKRNKPLVTSREHQNQANRRVIQPSFRTRKSVFAKRHNARYKEKVFKAQNKQAECSHMTFDKSNISSQINDRKESRKDSMLSCIGEFDESSCLAPKIDLTPHIRVKIKRKNLFKIPCYSEARDQILDKKFK